MAFDFAYDENLMNNTFFQTFRTRFSDLFEKAIAEKCVLCVPKTDSFPRYLLTLEDFLAHVLVPMDDIQFVNLCGAKIRINNGVIMVHHKIGRQTSARILFQETFYTEDGFKYKVLCVERPLDEGVASASNQSNIKVLKSYRDCVDFLWTESGTQEIMEVLDRELSEFNKKINPVDMENLDNIESSINSLYFKCMQIILRDPKVKKKYKVQKQPGFSTLKLAVETYLQQGTYEVVIKAITSCTESDDSKLNKLIRNYSDVNFKDVDISPKYYSNIPKARLELSRINGYSTALGKLECLKKTIVLLSEASGGKILVNADDLLQVFPFLIVKTSLANWNAQLQYLKLFYQSNHLVFDENCYLIATLEAAVLHIQNGGFTKSETDSSELENSDDSLDNSYLTRMESNDERSVSKREKSLHEFFRHVALGDLSSVKSVLEDDTENEVSEFESLNLCHPLCICDKCSNVLHDYRPTVNSFDDQGLTALHIASMYNVPNMVEYLLSKEADPNAKDCDGRTPSHYAALKGHQNALLLLLHKNADLNALDNASNTPLHLCSNNGHESCVKALVYYSEYSGIKLKVNQQNHRGETALHYASKWGYQNIVRILLESGSDPSLANKKKVTPIDQAHNGKILQLLREKCCNVEHYIKIKPENTAFETEKSIKKNQVYKGVQPSNAEDMKKVEKVLKAVQMGDVNLVCFFLGLDVSEFLGDGILRPDEQESNDVSEYKCHPLCSCEKCLVLEKDPNTEAEVEFKSGLDVNVCNAEGYTPLHVASSLGNVDLVKGFIRNNASVNVQTTEKLLTPLMLACQHRRLDVVKELLRSGSKVDLQDSRLNTALHYACNTGDVKLVEAVLKYEPNLNLKNIDNKTALQEAKEKISVEVMKPLRGSPRKDLSDI